MKVLSPTKTNLQTIHTGQRKDDTSELDKVGEDRQRSRDHAETSQIFQIDAPLNNAKRGVERPRENEDTDSLLPKRSKELPPLQTSASELKGPRPPKIISKLFYKTLDLLYFVIKEKSWPFSFNQPLPDTEASEKNIDKHSSPRDSGVAEPPMTQADVTSPSKPSLSPSQSDHSDTDYKPTYWDELRLKLLKEHDRLTLWKVGSSDRDLDGLLISKTEVYRDLGKIVLQTLLGIAEMIKDSINTAKSAKEPDTGNNASRLQNAIPEMEKLIEELLKKANENLDEKSGITETGYKKLVTPTIFLDRLHEDIAKLASLRPQIWIGAEDA
ncbi:hypothetical protein GGR57DRAFT_479506 [Xylariaceae sp. FL1272]|nr:hypothetical protein GGR57DRAFT_479506 [Xylariaceae sp. FL1272]